MDIHTQFINRFKYEVKSHACRGVNAAIRELDIAYESVQRRFGSIENIAEIRQRYVEAVNVKRSWGCNELTKVLEEIVWECF
ncbi:hypothetical protein ACP3VW_13530 [Vibrio sp. DNB22_17_1]